MCNKLLQTYACGHSKSICTTPCTHALASSQPSQLEVNRNEPISRSNSTVSSLAPATRENSTTNFSRLQVHSPRHATAAPASTRPVDIPAFRFVAPDTPSPTSPVSPVSPTFTSRHSNPSAAPSRFPSPAPSAAATEPEATFCDYYIPRYSFTSKYPCIECYMKSEWQGLRSAWMDNYQLGHPLDRGEDVERLSGVRDVSEKGGDV
ncbi:hypothetical protein M3J09_008795 [Ascochyta lentis]